MDNSVSNYIVLNSIGIIHTPYKNKAPRQPITEDVGEFRIVLDNKYKKGLKLLDGFKYIYVIYYLDKVTKSNNMIITPSWANKQKVGVFASRSPDRPNPIGLSVVKIKKIIDNTIYISGIDTFDGTPLLDIKPYIDKLDVRTDANYGWIDNVKDKEHLELHIKGIAHKH